MRGIAKFWGSWPLLVIRCGRLALAATAALCAVVLLGEGGQAWVLPVGFVAVVVLMFSERWTDYGKPGVDWEHVAALEHDLGYTHTEESLEACGANGPFPCGFVPPSGSMEPPLSGYRVVVNTPPKFSRGGVVRAVEVWVKAVCPPCQAHIDRKGYYEDGVVDLSCGLCGADLRLHCSAIPGSGDTVISCRNRRRER